MDEFLKHFAAFAPAIKQLQADGKSDAYIADLMEWIAKWLRSRSTTGGGSDER